MLYAEYRKWQKKNYRGGDGVLVASDAAQEWLLPWWWRHYRKHNDHPVTWVDFGMSEPMRIWCSERGACVPLPVISELFVATKEEVPEEFLTAWKKRGSNIWSRRNAWFKKPLAWLLTPYERTIWMDSDCEARRSLAPLFEACSSSGLAMPKIDYHLPPFYYYLGHLFAYRWGHSALAQCADQVFERSANCCTDDEILTQIILQHQLPIAELDPAYNRSWRDNDPNAAVVHWNGVFGKEMIQRQMNVDRLDELYGKT